MTAIEPSTDSWCVCDGHPCARVAELTDEWLGYLFTVHICRSHIREYHRIGPLSFFTHHTFR